LKIGGLGISGQGVEPLDPCLAIAEMRFDRVAGVTAHHLFERRFGFVKVAAIFGVIDHTDRPHFAQEPESLTGRAFAQTELLDDFRHAERFRREIEQPIGFGDRFGLTEQPPGGHEEVEDFSGEGIEAISGEDGVASGFGHGGCYSLFVIRYSFSPDETRSCCPLLSIRSAAGVPATSPLTRDFGGQVGAPLSRF